MNTNILIIIIVILLVLLVYDIIVSLIKEAKTYRTVNKFKESETLDDFMIELIVNRYSRRELEKIYCKMKFLDGIEDDESNEDL